MISLRRLRTVSYLLAHVLGHPSLKSRPMLRLTAWSRNAPGVINTMPRQTRAFAEHGNVQHALDADPAAARAILSAAAEDGVDLETIMGELEREGVKASVTPTSSFSPASNPSSAH